MSLTFNRLPSSLSTPSPVALPVMEDLKNADDSPAPSPKITKDLVELFKLLSDETRLRILFLLQKKQEMNVRSLCQSLQQSQPAVSHHLALLRGAGFLEMRREGKHNYYRISPQRFEEMLSLVFTTSTDKQNRIRFQNYELTYQPAPRE